MSMKRWEHFHHMADIGVRGFGGSITEAFEQTAVALTAVVTEPNKVVPKEAVEISCEVPDNELLLVDWLNALIYEMVTRRMLFGRFAVTIKNGKLHAKIWGEAADVNWHQPAVEIKGATYTELFVGKEKDGTWRAQCVVDV